MFTLLFSVCVPAYAIFFNKHDLKFICACLVFKNDYICLTNKMKNKQKTTPIS